MSLNGYAALLSRRDVRAVLTGVLVAGMAAAITLAVVLAVQQEESIAAAGAVAAAMLVGDGVVIPVRGRLIDRYGHRVLTLLGLVHAVPLLALAASIGHVPVWVLCALAVASGVTNAPLFAGLRSLWADVTDDPAELQAAYSLQSVFYETLAVAGPAAVAGVAAATSPKVALAIVAAGQLLGTLIFTSTRLSRAWRGQPSETGWLGALESPGVRVLALSGIGGGFLIGAVEVGVVAFARADGHVSASGLALAVLAVGSVVGGLVYGAHQWTSDLRSRYLALSGLLVIVALPLGLSGSLPVLAALLAVVGLVLTPWVAATLAMLDRVAPEGTATETTTWLIAAWALGAAIGSAVGGHVAQSAGAKTALEIAVAGGVVCLGVALAGQRTLRPATPVPDPGVAPPTAPSARPAAAGR